MKNKKLKLKKAIYKTYLDSQFWQVIMDFSEGKAGPFDGACLICAKGLILAAGSGGLVHIKSNFNGGQCEHYGALIGGVIYDFDGPCSCPANWLDRFKQNESINDRKLYYLRGRANNCSIVDDPEAVQQVAAILKKYL